MTICSAACQTACATQARGQKLLWTCFPPGQNRSRKVPKAHLLLMVLPIGWVKITPRGHWELDQVLSVLGCSCAWWDGGSPADVLVARSRMRPTWHRLGPLFTPHRHSILGLRPPIPSRTQGEDQVQTPAWQFSCNIALSFSQSSKTGKHIPFILSRAFIQINVPSTCSPGVRDEIRHNEPA